MASRIHPKIRLGVLILTSDAHPWDKWSQVQKNVNKTLTKNLPVDVFYIKGTAGRMGKFRFKFAAFLHLWLRRFSLVPLAPQAISRLPGLQRIFRHLLSGFRFPVQIQGENLVWQGPENYAFMAQKSLDCLDFCLSGGAYTHYLRTNNSSIWDFEQLLDLISTLPRTGLYAGVRGRFGKHEFASGAGVLLSSDVAQMLVTNRDQMAFQFVDDVTLGEYLLRDGGMSLTELSRQDAPFTAGPKLDEYHFRCKMGNDTENIMNHVGKFLLKKRTN